MARRDIDRLQGEIEELFADLWQVPRFAGMRHGFRPAVDCFVTEDPHQLNVVENAETIPVPRFLLGRVRPERVYALRVKGDSMIDEHICNGDIALIENRTDARDGEIVVALLVEENQATLKRIFRRGPNVELHPANSQLQVLTVPAKQVAVQGIFRGLLRPTS